MQHRVLLRGAGVVGELDVVERDVVAVRAAHVFDVGLGLRLGVEHRRDPLHRAVGDPQ